MPLSEFSLIRRFFSALGNAPQVELPVGDDCAILRLPAGERLATSVDTLVEGVHFTPGAAPRNLGFRAVSVAASDLAAAGARPLGMTLALTLPAVDEAWLEAFSEGIAEAVAAYALPLVGGDTTRGPLAITVQVLGTLPADAALLRSGARAGDEVYVSGTLGDAAAALALQRGEWRTNEADARALRDRLERPRARLDLGQRLLGLASAAIDISDGLLADAGHIAAASGVRLEIDPQSVPVSALLSAHPDREQVLRWALAGGDDYELCFCMGAGALPPEGTRIGRVLAGEGVDCGRASPGGGGYDHFSTPTDANPRASRSAP